MVKTYILAPNWTTAPPPDGPIRLGHLVDDLTELLPINREGIIDIPPENRNKLDTKAGFTTSRGNLVSGELGVAAKIMGLFGVGVGADTFYMKDKTDVLSCKVLDTMTFDPTTEYFNGALNVPEVKRFMEGARFKTPLYMVTGLKIARGASLQAMSAHAKGMQIRGGFQLPGLPVELGPQGSVTCQHQETESWEISTDFILAVRVRKVWYNHGKISHNAHNKSAVMHDGSSAQNETDIVLQIDDDIALTSKLSKAKRSTGSFRSHCLE